jgi:membrane-associated protein
VLASNGHMDIALVVALAALGAIVGDNAGYVLGRRLGRRALVARGPARRLRRRAVDASALLFAQYGGGAVVVGRFVGVGRIAIAWLAGAGRMPWKRFAAWNAAGSIAWAATVGGVAYALGSAGAHWLALAGFAIAVLAILHVWRVNRRLAAPSGTASPRRRFRRAPRR